jgi:aspartate aminotransferase-like enzyme
MSSLMTASSFGRFLLPGPTEVHPDVLAAMTRPMIPHRGADMERLLAGLEEPLRDLFRAARPVLIGGCSATGFMELAVRNGVRRRCLSLVGGAFGNRFAHIAAACAKEVIRLEVHPGTTVEPELLRDSLRRTPVDAVTLVHSETSTGALAPLADLAAVVREFPDVLLLVDGVTSVGGSPVETAAWDLDFVLTGSQKALALPPGLALGVASERLIERARHLECRGLYFDVLAFEEALAAHQPTNTPVIPLLYALERQLERIRDAGGIEARWARHEQMRIAVERWVAERGAALGVDLLPSEHHRSWTVSCLTMPKSVSGKAVVRAAQAAGYVIGTGYGALKERTIRIGHMGDHTVEGVEAVLGIVEEALT